MTTFKLRFILSAVAVGLAIGVAVALWQGSAAGSSAPASQAALPIAASAAAPPPQMPAVHGPRERDAALAGPADTAAAAAPGSMPDEDASAQVVPVVFHIRNRRDLNKIDGDIRNVTSRTLSITLRAVNSGTQASSEIQFQLAPGERRLYSNDDLYMQADDQLIVQSPPYQDRVVRVP